MSLVEQAMGRALNLGVPFSVQLDVTYRCNERCVHCYLDHNDHGEMTTAEIYSVLDQLAEAGTFFLILSGGEVFMRRDFLDIVEYARKLMFNVKVKTNGVMIHEKEAQRLRELGVEQIQISVYSHKHDVHDAITKLPGSLKKTIRSIRFLQEQGLKVTVANVLMKQNMSDFKAVQALSKELGVHYSLDPTITPMMDGNTDVLDLRIESKDLLKVFHDETLVGNVEEFCAPPAAAGADELDSYPCSAGHTACYISPYGEVTPCVQFPINCGNVREQSFLDIWNDSPQMQQVRNITMRDLHTCSGCSHGGTCTRCPGLAHMEGDMYGASTSDCEKSFERTGVPSANMLKRGISNFETQSSASLVQIQNL